MALVFYQKDILEKVTMKKPSNTQLFLSHRKHPFKRSACVVSQKLRLNERLHPRKHTYFSRTTH